MLHVLLVLQTLIWGQVTADVEAKQRPVWVELAKAHMKDCEVYPTENVGHPLRVASEPVFHHVQNVRGKSVGSVFLWLEESGRPGAVGDVFFLPSGKQHKLYNEWHSLASAPITVKWQGVTLLESAQAGLQWKEIANAGVPPDSRLQQERELRRFSRRFTAHLVNKQGDRYELRLLTTPLYQYRAEKEAEYLIGSLFTFCQETDPEIFLLIEARQTDKGPRWMYAAAEFSNLNLFMQFDGEEVWSANPPRFNSRGPHVGGPLRDVVLPPPSQNAGPPKSSEGTAGTKTP